MDPLLALLKQHPDNDWHWTLNPTQRAWSPANALALANCSLLAYADDSDIDQHLHQRQFETVIHCHSDHHASDTQAYVAVRPDAIVVAFRGTEPTNLRDFVTDFDARQVPFATKLHFSNWGQVHEGFADGVIVVLQKVLDALTAHDTDARSLWLTGHSLGGALAVVTAAFLANVPAHPIAGVYTFGQPRVGDPDFCARYHDLLGEITFRCVNDRDIVPHVPPRELSHTERVLVESGVSRIADLASLLRRQPGGADRYEHAGHLRLLLPNGGVSEQLADEAAREPRFLAQPRTVRSLFLALPSLLLQFPELLKDHAPINPFQHDGYIERLKALL